MAILSDTKARKIKPDDGQIAHGGVTGLVLIPAKTKGHGKWVLRFVVIPFRKVDVTMPLRTNSGGQYSEGVECCEKRRIWSAQNETDVCPSSVQVC